MNLSEKYRKQLRQAFYRFRKIKNSYGIERDYLYYSPSSTKIQVGFFYTLNFEYHALTVKKHLDSKSYDIGNKKCFFCNSFTAWSAWFPGVKRLLPEITDSRWYSPLRGIPVCSEDCLEKMKHEKIILDLSGPIK